jgi:hypothetical protein
MEPTGEYQVTRHKGHSPDSKNARVFYSRLDEAPAMRTYRWNARMAGSWSKQPMMFRRQRCR